MNSQSIYCNYAYVDLCLPVVCCVLYIDVNDEYNSCFDMTPLCSACTKALIEEALVGVLVEVFKEILGD
jgi:hypothetical protein